MTTPALFDMREIVQRNTARMRLRTLLADGRWHGTAELLHVAGSGISSRIRELRVGADRMPALEIECAKDPRTGRWRYRVTGETIPGANLDGGALEAPRAELEAAADLMRACPAYGVTVGPRVCDTCSHGCPAPGVTP